MSTSSLGLAFGNSNTLHNQTGTSQKNINNTINSNIPMISSQHMMGSQNISMINTIVGNNKFYMVPIQQIRFGNDDRFFDQQYHRNRTYGQYIGERKNDMQHGYGELWYQNGDYYVGYWEQNMPSGQGLLFFSNSNNMQSSNKQINAPRLTYSGYFQKGYFHGIGKLFLSNSATQGQFIYIGNWKNGKRQGYGREYYGQNQKNYYLGEWQHDMRHGQGKLFFDNGVYEGKWMQNMMHGDGMLTVRDGSNKTVTVGIWQRDQLLSGQISYHQIRADYQNTVNKDTFQSGLYKGQIKNYLRNGEGCYQIEGAGYYSKFVDDQPVGDGILKGSIQKNDYQIRANFTDNKISNIHTNIKYWNKDEYDGKADIENWVIKRTDGKYYYSNGSAIQGKFKDNPQGQLQGKYWEIN